jgi:hypothetical protein
MFIIHNQIIIDVVVIVVVCLLVCRAVNDHGRSQSKTIRKYSAVSTWSIVMADSSGETCTKFLLLGLSNSRRALRMCSKSSSYSPQHGHVESIPWTLFRVSPSSRERPPLSWASKTLSLLEAPCRRLKGPSPYTCKVREWLGGPSLT